MGEGDGADVDGMEKCGGHGGQLIGSGYGEKNGLMMM